ncbi:DNA-processing protein DprA [Microbacterium enclense]|uniref:DNA-processing protein DprA n=1 Tax=Microbacterium enclense TaxID=993073 RepID=UPI003F823C69
MSTFDESKHDRDGAGKFREMAGSEQTDLLLPAADEPELPGEFLAIWEGPSEHAVEAFSRATLTALAEPADRAVGAAVNALGAAEVLRIIRGDAGLDDEAAAAALRVDARTLTGYRARLRDSGRIFRDAQRAGLSVRTAAEGGIPSQFADLGDAAPLALWTKGDPAVLATMSDGVSLVGARAATSYGETLASETAAALAGSGRTIVSGGAYGIDAAAHRGAMAPGGKTVVFLAGGADRPYPVGNSGLIERAAQGGGLIVSEVPPGAMPTKWRLLARNRLIASATPVSVVVEAGQRSGSLNEARHATEVGRVVAAFPGPVTSAASSGSNQLIAEGHARLVTSAADIQSLLEAVR